MDVQLGCCWRCENPIKRNVPCDFCGEAKYCGEICRFRDQWRHTPQCAEWKPKRCSNPKCCKESAQLKECSACCDTWYCGEACQRQHWKAHKPSCHERTKEIRETVAPLKVVLRYNSYYVNLRCPYYIGNALAIDMLNLPGNELCSEDVKSEKTSKQDPLKDSYSILSAGCGNLRNWIHTVASLPNGFKGTLHTVLDDYDPYVQARNVLQLYMMIKYCDDPNIAEGITTIWYSLHLPEKDYKLLTDCLRALLGYSADDLDKLTGGALHIAQGTLTAMRPVWKAWLELECRKGYPNYIDLHEQRKRLLYQYQELEEGQRLYRKGLPSELIPSFDEYDQHGNFIPPVNGRPLPYDNPTLTGYLFTEGESRGVGTTETILEDNVRFMVAGKYVYCIEYQLMPFSEWDYLKVKKHHYNKSMVVMFHSFISDQIKQTIASIKAGAQRVSVMICNCVHISRYINEEYGESSESYRFDRIFTSNIADFIGTQVVLKAMKPLLNRQNKCSTIITQYWNWYFVGPYYNRDDEIFTASNKRLAAFDIHSDDIEMLYRLAIPLVRKEECRKDIYRGYYFLQEYFNNMIWFINYLRAEYLATDEGAQSTKPPTFQKVKQSEGLQLRDFRRGNANKVVPFRYRRSVRASVNQTRGMDRMLEWHLA
ncbi:uncharacterized protein [Amphiura filiformis]|uniref:uncharacterized protein n=1 Tax=Amphiura filiformis TaxID=82378 RepID=UPI003B2254FF